MISSLRRELRAIRRRVVLGDEESLQIALEVIDRVLSTIEDEPEEHLRKLRQELGVLDDLLGRIDAELVKSANPAEENYQVPKSKWSQLIARRDNALALSNALVTDQWVTSCPRCRGWVPIPHEDLPDGKSGRAPMRCPCGHEWIINALTLGSRLTIDEDWQFFLPKRKDPET